MAATNLFDDLKKALGDFKSFLDANVGTIKPAIQALRSMVPQVDTLLNKLVDLMGQLKAEVQKINPGLIPGLDKVTTFTNSTKSLLETARGLLPEQAGAINDVLQVVDVVSSLPSLDQVKQEIISLIDAIVVHLNNLKS
jgi:ABC-type transporter Mla subunit MlaD